MEQVEDKAKNIQVQMYRKFISDAVAMLGNDGGQLAFHIRVKLEEAAYLGGILIRGVQAPVQAPVQPPASAPVSPSETPQACDPAIPEAAPEEVPTAA